MPPSMDQESSGRHETATERIDRNWAELLQELRVTQTGVQLLTGFLLTLPFQSRFEMLDSVQRGIFLVVVLLSVVATGLLIAPVGFHRVLFRHHRKPELVKAADRFARAGLAVLAVVVTGVVLLVFDVVAGRTAGIAAAAGVGTLVVVCWWVVPTSVLRRSSGS